ncbi:hypothetical protein Hanom_Chr13g01201961 [Helianthus anomalus]
MHHHLPCRRRERRCCSASVSLSPPESLSLLPDCSRRTTIGQWWWCSDCESKKKLARGCAWWLSGYRGTEKGEGRRWDPLPSPAPPLVSRLRSPVLCRAKERAVCVCICD